MILLEVSAEVYKIISGIAGGVISVLMSVLIFMLRKHINTLMTVNETVTELNQKAFFFEKTLSDLKSKANTNSETITEHEKRIQKIEIKQNNCPVFKKNK